MPEIATIALTATPPKDTVCAALDDPAVFARLVTYARTVTRDLAVDHDDLVQSVYQTSVGEAEDPTPIPVKFLYGSQKFRWPSPSRWPSAGSRPRRPARWRA